MSRSINNYKGFILPMHTCFKNNGILDLNEISRDARDSANKGIKGILINSPFSDKKFMPFANRRSVTEAWVKEVSKTKQHLMVEVGGTTTYEAVGLAKHANSQRVGSILCLPQLYYDYLKPTTPEKLIEYLKQVGDAAPQTPLLYHHNPEMTKVNIHMGKFLELIGDKIPSFAGIKFASENFEEAKEAFKAAEKKYVIFLANDKLISHAYTFGIHSFIPTTSKWYLQTLLDLYAACEKGEWSKIFNLQWELSKIAEDTTVTNKSLGPSPVSFISADTDNISPDETTSSLATIEED